MDKLHQELLEYIARRLDPAAVDGHAALKQLRLVDKRFATCVTPILFSTVHLTRNADSFERAMTVAQDFRLTSHVRRLIYHTDTIPDQEMHVKFKSFSEQYQHVRNVQSHYIDRPAPPAAGEQELRALHNNLLEALRIQQSFIRSKTEIKQLTVFMTKFTGLAALECSDDFSSVDASEGYISRRTGLIPDELASGSPERNLFRLLTASFYADILVSSMTSKFSDWQYFAKFGIFKDKLRGQLSGLRVLEVTFDSMWLVRLSEINKARDGFVAFLGAAPNLTSLTLEMGELPWMDSAHSHDGPRAVADVILRLMRWPKLKHLSISGLATNEQDLVSFFVAHAASLRTLRLGHVEMPLHDMRKSGSIISLFVRLRNICQLRKVSLWGRYGNRWDEAWYVPQEQGRARGSIRAEIEEYICHRGGSPFVGLERHFRPAARDQYDLKKANPENVLSWPDDDEEDAGSQSEQEGTDDENDKNDEQNANGKDDDDDIEVDIGRGRGSEGVDEEWEEDDPMEPEEFSDHSWVWCPELLS